MEGILKRNQMPADEMPPEMDEELEEGAPVEDEMLPGQEPATPEEQEAFDNAAALGKKIMAGKGFLDRMLSSVKQQGLGPGVADAVVMVVEQVDRRMDLPETVILTFASELATFAFAACARARIVREDDETKIAEVMQAVLQGLAQIYDFDPADAQEFVDAQPDEGQPTEEMV